MNHFLKLQKIPLVQTSITCANTKTSSDVWHHDVCVYTISLFLVLYDSESNIRFPISISNFFCNYDLDIEGTPRRIRIFFLFEIMNSFIEFGVDESVLFHIFRIHIMLHSFELNWIIIFIIRCLWYNQAIFNLMQNFFDISFYLYMYTLYMRVNILLKYYEKIYKGSR